jgi:hypothetical protein
MTRARAALILSIIFRLILHLMSVTGHSQYGPLPHARRQASLMLLVTFRPATIASHYSLPFA